MIIVRGRVLVLGRSGSSACVIRRALSLMLRVGGLCDCVFYKSGRESYRRGCKKRK